MTQATGRSRIPWQAFHPKTDLKVVNYEIHTLEILLDQKRAEREELLEVQGLTRYVE